MKKVKIEAKNGYGTKIYVDGEEVKDVYAYSVKQSVDDGCALRVELHIRFFAESVEFETDDAELQKDKVVFG